MTILVTGAGMVGTATAARLVAAGEQVVLFDVAFSPDNLDQGVAAGIESGEVVLRRGDITELAELLDAIRANRVSRIIHTASLLTSTVAQRPVKGVATNLVGTVSVLEAARLAGLDRVVFCSSASGSMGRVNPDLATAVPEDFSLRTVSEYPPSIYATLKLSAEWLSHNYEDAYDLPTVSMRLGGIFGPWRGTPSGGPSRLLQHVVECAWQEQPVTLSAADLRQTMDFIYVPDVAKGLVLAATRPDPPSRVYNLSGGALYSIDDVVTLLGAHLGRPINLQLREADNRGSYGPSPPIDIQLARTELGFEPDYPLPRALEHYLAWCDQNPTAVSRG